MRSSHRHKNKGCLLNGKFETSKRNSVKCRKWIWLAIVRCAWELEFAPWNCLGSSISSSTFYSVRKKLLVNLYLYFAYYFYDLAWLYLDEHALQAILKVRMRLGLYLVELHCGTVFGDRSRPSLHNVIRLNISPTLTGNFLGQYLPYKILLLCPGKRVSNQSRKEWLWRSSKYSLK